MGEGLPHLDGVQQFFVEDPNTGWQPSGPARS